MPVIKKTKPAVSRAQAATTGTVIDRIQSIGDTDLEGIKLSIYGQSGSGKTTFYSSFPAPILSIICSGPGELRSVNTAENKNRIECVCIESPDEIRELVEYQRDTGKYKTISLDHASGLQEMVLAELLGIKELPPQSSWGLATQQQWGQCALQTKEYMRALIGLKGVNTVIVAQEREFNVEGDVRGLMPHVGSALSPSVTGWLNAAVDYVCQTLVREQTVIVETKVGKVVVKTTKKTGIIEYCLRTRPDPVYMTKFRLPKGTFLPDVIVDPTYDKMMELIGGS